MFYFIISIIINKRVWYLGLISLLDFGVLVGHAK